MSAVVLQMRIYTDFDGTITDRDSIVLLVQEFGGGDRYRRDLLSEFENGTLSAAEVIAEEIASVDASWEEVAACLKQTVRVDPTFPGFVNWCRESSVPLCVVSSGLEQIIAFMIGDLGVPVVAHTARIDGRSWRYYRRPESEKESVVRAASDADEVTFIGDGISDICVLPYVDRVFAKRYLEKYCRKRGIDFLPYDTFQDVRIHLQAEFQSD